MPNLTVAAITKTCANSNMSGLKPYIKIAEEWEIAAIPAATDLVVSTDITLVAAASPIPAGSWKQWDISKVPSKNIFESVQTGDADSGARQTTVTVFIPLMTAARLNAMYGGCGFVIGVHDQNGAVRIVGEKENGCTMTITETINEGTNGCTVVFTWTSGHTPYFYTGEFTA